MDDESKFDFLGIYFGGLIISEACSFVIWGKVAKFGVQISLLGCISGPILYFTCY